MWHHDSSVAPSFCVKRSGCGHWKDSSIMFFFLILFSQSRHVVMTTSSPSKTSNLFVYWFPVDLGRRPPPKKDENHLFVGFIPVLFSFCVYSVLFSPSSSHLPKLLLTPSAANPSKRSGCFTVPGSTPKCQRCPLTTRRPRAQASTDERATPWEITSTRGVFLLLWFVDLLCLFWFVLICFDLFWFVLIYFALDWVGLVYLVVLLCLIGLLHG